MSGGEGASGAPPAETAPLSPYQRKLFVFLGVASFFEGYDFIALTQILPNFRADMGVGKDLAGLLLTIVNLGTVAAYVLVQGADRWGRKKVLTWTIAGYTTLTFLSGLAPDPWTFCVLQAFARVFLIGEYATSMVVAAEEFPSARRGVVMGVISAFSSLGAIVCAGTVPFLLKTPYGWRTVYFAALLPLVIVAYARRDLRETRRFEEKGREAASLGLFGVWKTPHRRRVVELGAIWFVAYIASQTTITFWKDFAVTERGLTDGDVGLLIPAAAVLSMPLVFLMGRAMDRIGRKPASVVVFLSGAVGTFGAYTFHGKLALGVALVFGIFSSGAFLQVLNTFTAELFPTESRASGYAWANNLLGRLGYVGSPVVVGYFAEQLGWGPVIRMTAICPLIALGLILLLLPETKGRTLEETAAL